MSASLEPSVTQPRRAGTIEELRAMEARGEIIGMTGLPLALRLCPYCRFFGTLGETCPASLRCPSCGSTAVRCRRPSGHDATSWHTARVRAADEVDAAREAAGDPTLPAPWPPEAASGQPLARSA